MCRALSVSDGVGVVGASLDTARPDACTGEAKDEHLKTTEAYSARGAGHVTEKGQRATEEISAKYEVCIERPSDTVLCLLRLV